MAKKPTPAPVSKEVAVSEVLIAEDIQASNTLAAAIRETDTRTRAVAIQLGYQLPADCTDPDLIQRDIAANMRRSVEACLQVGMGLRVLKEACAHGEFEARLDALGIEHRVAQKFMQSARKFSKAPTSALLGAAGTQNRLFEMLVLDDEQIEELELTGQTGELSLDDVATMSVKELRAALRKEKAVRKRFEDVNSELNTELALKKNLKIAATDWPERFKGLMDQAALAERTLMNQIGALEAIRATATEDQPQSPEEEEPLNRARAVLADQMSAAYQRITEYLEKSGLLFDRTLGAYAEEVRK